MEGIVGARLGQESGSDDVDMQRFDWSLASTSLSLPLGSDHPLDHHNGIMAFIFPITTTVSTLPCSRNIHSSRQSPSLAWQPCGMFFLFRKYTAA